MQIIVAFLLLLSIVTSANAETFTNRPGRFNHDSISRKTDRGLFIVEVRLPSIGLKKGNNSFDLRLMDPSGRSVDGASLMIVPWLLDRNHGVWEKPVVTERGNGTYHVDNVSLAMAGRWELKITVVKSGKEDRVAIPTIVNMAIPESQKRTALPRGNYKKSLHRYSIPDVNLLNQDGRNVNLRSLVESGKPVVIDFIYTTCNTICPVLSASFTNLRRVMGKDADKVQLISISIDPEHDRPDKMKQYLSRFTKGTGWDFLTGSRKDIDKVLRALDATVVDKMAHEPLYLLHGSHSADWVRIKGLLGKSDLLTELQEVENR